MTLSSSSGRVHYLAVLATAMLVCSTAAAEGWGLPSLNPFAKKSKTPTSARVSDSESSFSLLPKWGSSAPKKRSTGPSAWNRMTTAINPWAGKSKPAASAEPSPTGSFNPFSTASSSTKKSASEKKSFLPSWTSTPEEDSGPKSVNDFLKMDAPEYP